jgi:hemolysin activation/secretion protein
MPVIRKQRRRPGREALAGVLGASIFLMPLAIQAQDRFALPPMGAAGGTAAPQTVTLQRIAFTGNTVVSNETLQAIAAPYLARPASADDLEDLRQKLTRVYTERGYVNSGVVWQGDATGGVLTGQVMEGRLSAIRLHGMQRLDERYLTRRLATAADGPFNLEVLRERFQLALGDPLIERMNARLIPGEQAGEAILDVDVALARPWQFSVFANNYRAPSIGANAVGASASFRNLTGYGDLLEGSYQNAPGSAARGRASLSWNMPLGFAGTRFSLALEHGDSAVVEQPAAALEINGQLNSVDVGLSQTLVESLAHKLSVGINRAGRTNRTLLMGFPFSFTPNEPEGVTRETLWRVWQDYSYRTPTQVVALRSTFSVGRNNVVDVPGLPPTDSPAKSFHLWTGQGQWGRQIMDNGAQLVVRGTLQHTSDRLLALDGLSLGGVNTVRGYRENTLVRDTGTIVNLEFDYPLQRSSNTGAQVNLVPFVDYGQARNVGGPTSTLASAGVAARVQWMRFYVDLAVAKRLRNSDAPAASSSSRLQDAGIHLQIAYRF